MRCSADATGCSVRRSHRVSVDAISLVPRVIVNADARAASAEGWHVSIVGRTYRSCRISMPGDFAEAFLRRFTLQQPTIIRAPERSSPHRARPAFRPASGFHGRRDAVSQRPRPISLPPSNTPDRCRRRALVDIGRGRQRSRASRLRRRITRHGRIVASRIVSAHFSRSFRAGQCPAITRFHTAFILDGARTMTFYHAEFQRSSAHFQNEFLPMFIRRCYSCATFDDS